MNQSNAINLNVRPDLVLLTRKYAKSRRINIDLLFEQMIMNLINGELKVDNDLKNSSVQKLSGALGSEIFIDGSLEKRYKKNEKSIY